MKRSSGRTSLSTLHANLIEFYHGCGSKLCTEYITDYRLWTYFHRITQQNTYPLSTVHCSVYVYIHSFQLTYPLLLQFNIAEAEIWFKFSFEKQKKKKMKNREKWKIVSVWFGACGENDVNAKYCSTSRWCTLYCTAGIWSLAAGHTEIYYASNSNCSQSECVYKNKCDFVVVCSTKYARIYHTSYIVHRIGRRNECYLHLPNAIIFRL